LRPRKRGHDESSPPTDDGTPDEGTSDEGTSDDGTSDDGTSDDGTSDDGTSDDGTSDDGTSDEGTLDEGTPDEGTLDEGTPDEGTLDEGTLDEGTPDEGAPDEGAPADATPADATKKVPPRQLVLKEAWCVGYFTAPQQSTGLCSRHGTSGEERLGTEDWFSDVFGQNVATHRHRKATQIDSKFLWERGCDPVAVGIRDPPFVYPTS
jgi:hypothetical protein